MPTIDVSDEDLQFLRELAHELRTQNNCGTAAPYFYVVRTWKELVAPPGYGDREVVVDYNGGDARVFVDEKGAKTELTELLKDDELEEALERLEHFGMHKVEESRNVFFTRKGYDEHMRLNDHNYGGTTCQDPHPYVEHAFRNPEIRRLLEVIQRLGVGDG